MRIIRCTHDALEVLGGRRAITLGTFDGVHLGHQEVLTQLRRAARARDFEGPCAVTFAPHPREILSPDQVPALLNSRVDRERMLAAAGVDLLVVLEFTPALAALEHETFVRELLIERLGLAHFVLGHDVHFGRGRGGNTHSVSELGASAGFVVSQVPSVSVGGSPVSSTRIREALVRGEVEAAIDLLGHPHLLSGDVRHGRHLGRSIGFPTANLELPPRRVVPALGVYGGWARWDEGAWHPAVLNIGRAPTVTPDGSPRVEVHLPGIEADLYDRHLEVAVARRLRAERHFGGVEELRAAIARDVESLPSALAEVGPMGLPRRLDDLSGPGLA